MVISQNIVDWVKKAPCKKYVDEEVARMSGQRPKGQDETQPDAGQGLEFEEAGLPVVGAEDPALKNLSVLEKEPARKAGIKLTTMVEELSPPSWGRT